MYLPMAAVCWQNQKWDSRSDRLLMAPQLTELGRKRVEFDSVATELAIANTHFYLAKKLYDAERGEFRRELYKSLDFWGYTIRAHFQSAILCLCRVYDAQRDDSRSRTLHLLRLVKQIDETKLTGPQKNQRRADVEFLQRNEPKSSKQPDPKVAKLRRWRHKLVAHRDYDLAIDGREEFLKQYPVDLEEIQALIDEGFSMLERWAFYYHARPQVQKLVERKDDYVYVLESLRLSLKREAKREN